MFAVAGLVSAGLLGAVGAVLSVSRSAVVLDRRIDQAVLAFAGLAFISWLFEARINLDGVKPRLRWNALWAYAGWWVPGVSLVVPLLVVNEIDSTTQRLANGSARHGLFAAWAVSWTVLQFVYVGSGGPGGAVAAGIVQAVAAVPAVLLVLRITAQQEIAALKAPRRRI
jgi:hypothetical protein